jgi:hypothetical protein
MNTIRKCMTIKTEERNLPSGSYKKPEEGKEEEHLKVLTDHSN